MKRNILIVITMVVLTFLYLILGNVIHMKTPSMEEYKATAKAFFDKETMVESDGVRLRKNYGISIRDAEDLLYYAPKSTMDASEIIIIKFVNEDMAIKALSVIESRSKKLEDQFKNYKPDQAEILSKAYKKVSGKYIIYISSKDSEKFKEKIESLSK